MSNGDERDLPVDPPSQIPTCNDSVTVGLHSNTDDTNGTEIPTTINSNLSILQWNCRNLHTNLSIFKQFLSTVKFDVICLQSVGRRYQDLPILAGYYYPPIYTRRSDGVVAVATYVSEDRRMQSVRAPCSDDTLAVCVQISTTSRSINIVNIYYPDGCSGKTDWLVSLDTSVDWVVVGDFNAHHALWGGTGTEARGGGAGLAENIVNANLFLLNDGSPTRLPDRAEHTATAIDLSLVSPTLAPHATWHVVEDDMGSDHLPLHISFNKAGPEVRSRDTARKYNYHRADWEAFSSRLSSADIPFFDDLSKQYDVYKDVVLSAADACIPRKGQGRAGEAGNPWWNDDCRLAVKNKKHWLRKYRQSRFAPDFEGFKEARLQCRKTIAAAKKAHWEKFLNENVTQYQDAGSLWKKVKKLKNKYNLPEQPIVVNGKVTTTEKEKAEALADVFAAASQSQSLSKEEQERRAAQSATFRSPLADTSSALNLPFTHVEVVLAIRRIKNIHKATGADGVSYSMIQHYPPNILHFVTDYFNRCWREGCVPDAWTSALVVPILKHGKPRRDPKSYRPISLTPHTGKVFERLVKGRIEHLLEKEKVIPILQAGFRKGRGCTDHIVRLSSHIKKASARGLPTMATFFDVKSAYDAVWMEKLYHKLAGVGVSGSLYDAIVALTRRRVVRVKIGSALSEERWLDMGVPQGSIIAPTLYNIMMADITSIKFNKANIIMYADDIAIWSTIPYKRFSDRTCATIRNNFQSDVNKIVDYMRDNGFCLSPDKTVLMFFPARHRVDITKFYVTINGQVIKAATSTRYLGVIFDHKMSWGPHVQHLLDKASSAVGLIRTLKHVEGCNNVKALLHVTRALIRSRLTYGQEAFFAAARTTLCKLQAKECAVLRVVLDLPRGAPQELVYREAGWLPLDKERELRCAQYVVRAQGVENSTSEEVLLDYDNANSEDNVSLRLRHHTIAERNLSIASYAQRLSSVAGTQEAHVNNQTTSPFPPWLMEKAEIVTDCSTVTKSTNPLLLTTHIREYIDARLQNHLHIYTDGSKQDDGCVGCAFSIPALKIVKQYRLDDHISIFSSELFAIYMALTHIVDMPVTINGIAILTDSKSSLQALQRTGGNRGDLIVECQFLIHQIITRGTEVTLMWIPSHVGIGGNERVDAAAKEACSLPSVSVHIGHTVSELCTRLRAAATDLYKAELRETAAVKGWFDDSFSPAGVHPDLPLHLLPLFYRLRTQSLRFSYLKQQCYCAQPLSFQHIFSCPETAALLCEIQARFNCTSPAALLCKHAVYGWKVTMSFIRELSRLKIAALL